MFCRNCGKEVAEQAVACMACGLAPTNGNKFCWNCAAETNAAAIVCVKCGVPTTKLAVRRAPPAASPTSNMGTETSVLEKCYFPFLITLVVIFGLGALTVGYSYFFGLFVPGIGFSICNFVVGRDNRFGTSPYDLVTMILAPVSLIPLVGWFTQIAALAISIIALVKYLKTKKGESGASA